MEFTKMGVFSPCANLDSASMIKCLQALLRDYPSIEFTAVETDNKYRGFKVFFSKPKDSIVLEKNQLSSEESVSIYPLTAHLVILNVDHKKTPLYERELCDAIKNKFGKVLKIEKKDNPNKSRNWFIEIDIPEFRELFQESYITLPIPGRNEDVVLTLWCELCKVRGHFKHECFSRLDENEIRSKLKEEENTSGGQVGEGFKEQLISSPDRNVERIPKPFSNFPLETTERYAERIGREEVMSFSKEKVKNKENATATANTEKNINSNMLPVTDIKKESGELAQNNDAKRDKNTENKKSAILENDDRTLHSFSDTDDIEIIDYTDNLATNKSSSNSSARAETRNFEEDSRSLPETKSTNLPNSALPVIPESPPVTAKTPRGAEVTTTLSERLQECINEVCAKVGVLDRKKLDAFLIHVKKKSNPIRVALNFTSNTKGLKEQLQAILHKYYNTPQTGTREDIQFIKWLNGLVDRYDGSIPKKRKRGGKTDDEHAAKR